MDYKTNLVLHISFSFFFLFLVHCLKSIVFLISFMDFLINKLYLVSCIWELDRQTGNHDMYSKTIYTVDVQ